jgi:hypothetical protein
MCPLFEVLYSNPYGGEAVDEYLPENCFPFSSGFLTGYLPS